ncbi:hypothetical protein [Mycobacterium heckeshornense]|uniref:Uncharacterized protein n=1 Tax=Mycobacterium heckeshornense TaxID=110505 RepID=A0A2I3F1E3_9MYCO|nr:hypothetical protein [Mycobacterium heckeshornense]KMV24484.1 hypothetical protein ACT16_01000 [Mycobacterium heckeshornense]MCV7035559.1 hypothetical protein [Mycobacterium heckeshornense]BCO37843.1 hypothetical protein MHEC_42760 [Mycobacterium heckeshornense]
MYDDQSHRMGAEDAKMLRECGVHKIVIADHDGGCLAYLLAWGMFGYDAETDTYVCFTDRDGKELMTVYTEGDVKPDPTTGTYAVTAPTAATSPSEVALR